MAYIEILKYILFGFSSIATLISFMLSSDLFNRKIFRALYLIALSLFGLGIIFELLNIFELKKGGTLLIMSLSLFNLTFFEILRRLFKLWKGVNPCFPDDPGVVGSSPLNGFWYKYPEGRRVMRSDFLFVFLQFSAPLLTIIMLFLITLN